MRFVMAGHHQYAALAYAANGLAVLPLRGKIPLTAHGLKDASVDPQVIRRMWSRWPSANVGLAVPDDDVVIDIDPRNGGDDSLLELEIEHGPLPTTLTCLTGGTDGGSHRWFRRPPGELLLHPRPGIDLRTKHYVVAPPSVHPESGRRYTWVQRSCPIAPMPAWLAAVVVKPKPPSVRPRPLPGCRDEVRPGDAFNDTATWDDVLVPAGWVKVARTRANTYWRRPGKSSGWSASTGGAGDWFYAFTTSTCFEPERGYTKFAAWAILNHGGDFTAAARALRSA